MSLPKSLYRRGNADDSIIASSPLVAGSCECPHRVVLRDIGREYVVHTQVVPADGSGSTFFHGGHYFSKRHDGALRDAFAQFIEQSQNTLNN